MRTLFLSLLLLAAGALSAQDCFQTSLTLSSSFSSGGPSFINWQLFNDEDAEISSGIMQFNAQTTSGTFNDCLQAGCYTFIGTSSMAIESFTTFLNVQPSGGYVNIYENEWIDGVMYVYFCIVENGDCNLEVGVSLGGACNEIHLEAVEFNQFAQIYWSVNGVELEGDIAATFTATEPGSYFICAAYETPDCPEGVVWCETFIVDAACFDEPADCTLEFSIAVDGCEAMFGIEGNDDYLVFFFVDDILVSEGQDVFSFELPTAQAGVGVNYSFCAEVIGDGPCNGTVWCETITVTSCVDCSIEINYEETECGEFIFTADVPNGWQDVHWTVNEQPQPGLVWMQQLTLEDGVYEICAWYEMPACGLVEQCVTVVVDCGADDCPLNLEVNQPDLCGNAVFTALGQPDGASIQWYINDSFSGVGDSFEYIPVSSGDVVICAGYETPECPQGVFVCETLIYSSDCFENECPFSFEPVAFGCNAFLYLSGASPEGLIYSVNDVVVAENEMGIDYNFGGNGVFLVCAEVTQGLCAGEVFCETIVIDDCDECIELTILIENNIANLPDEMIIDALLNYIEIFADFDVVFSTSVDGGWSITACLPAACYECEIGLPEFPFSDYQVDFIVEGAAVYQYTVSAAEPSHTFDLAVGEDCTVNVLDIASSPVVHAYPNPANEHVTVFVDGAGVYAYSLFDLTGRMVAAGSLFAGVPNVIGLSALPAGVYLLDLDGVHAPMRTRIIVAR